MLLSDAQILDRCDRDEMISPYEDRLHRDGKISWGLSSYGYDIRLGGTLLVPREQGRRAGQDFLLVDPAHHDRALDAFYEAVDVSSTYVMAPGTHVLGTSIEYITVPDDVLVIPTGKSTYARCGLIVNMTPFEPGWRGHPTITLVNPGPFSVVVYAYQGIAQLLFFKADQRTLTTYAERMGKYQDARRITGGKVEYAAGE